MAEPTVSSYPSALDDDTSLGGDQVNITSFTLGSSVNSSQTTIPASATISGVTAPFYLLADSELIYVESVSGSDFNVVVRGAGGTTAAAHSSGITLFVVYAANLFNQLKRSIVAIETELGLTPKGSFADVNTLLDVLSKPADGTMFNGEISVTVVASDLVVALKNKAGSDPSSSDPVGIMINGSLRLVTAATSITLADATNWFNSGGLELATKEVDYFLYAIWDSNSSIVAIGPSRIPYGRLVSDFSGTTTSETYLGNHANYTSTDDVVVIGRFAATLSGGAGYTWSVPTFTSRNLIHEPIRETRWLDWVPQFTNLTVGNGTLSAKYRAVSGRVQFKWALVFGSTSAISGSVSYTLPFSRESTFSGLVVPAGVARYFDTSGPTSYGGLSNYLISGSTANLIVFNAAGTYLSTTGLSSTVPMTWATGDEIELALAEYPIA